MREKAILLENMNRLRKVGVRFALDDFGTGQCNLNYIVEMPVDIVKFDSAMTKAYFKNGKVRHSAKALKANMNSTPASSAMRLINDRFRRKSDS